MKKQNYGFLFNDIIVTDTLFIKQSKNEYGNEKIKNEILFYKNILDLNIHIPIPKIYTLDSSNAIIEMELLKNCVNITSIYFNSSHKQDIIEHIINNISIIHEYKKQRITKEIYKKNIKIEIYDKIITRYNELNLKNDVLFNSIDSVNNVNIKNLYYYLKLIYKKINNIISKKPDYYFNLIHGDIHLGNIMVDVNDNSKIFFIDPRGYYGETKLYGIKEYDYAKLLFGISGYSMFDDMMITHLNITNTNIQIDFIETYCTIFESTMFDELTKLLALSIWLGNANKFYDYHKNFTSLMISFYLCEKFL
jgi:hypothetical protein